MKCLVPRAYSRPSGSGRTQTTKINLIIREYATRSAVRWTESLGGDFSSNRFSIDVSQAVFFVPFGNAPLRRSLVARLHLQSPWHSAGINIASGVTPDGKVRYGVDGSTFLGESLGGGSPAGGCCCCNGKFMIEGTVTDEKGLPVARATLRVGKELVFTDGNGQFFMRVKRGRPIPIAVVPSEFTTPGLWAVVECPANSVPDVPLRIIVRRQP